MSRRFFFRKQHNLINPYFINRQHFYSGLESIRRSSPTRAQTSHYRNRRSRQESRQTHHSCDPSPTLSQRRERNDRRGGFRPDVGLRRLFQLNDIRLLVTSTTWAKQSHPLGPEVCRDARPPELSPLANPLGTQLLRIRLYFRGRKSHGNFNFDDP